MTPLHTSACFIPPAQSVWPNAVCNDSKLSSLWGVQTFISFLAKSLVCVQEGHHQNWISFTIYWSQSQSPRSKWDSSQNLRIINFTSASFPPERTGDLSILPNCDSINASNFILYLPSNFSWLTRKGWRSSNVQAQHSFADNIERDIN